MLDTTLRIQGIQKRNGWNQTQIARYLGVPIGTLRNWYYGDRDPGPAVRRLLDVLGTVEALSPATHAALTEGIE